MNGFQVLVGSDPSNAGNPAGGSSQGPWRPPQWNQTQLFSITANIPSGSGGENVSSTIDFGDGQTQTPNPGGTNTPTTSTTPTTYFFDGTLRLEHSQEIKKTEHPVQSGSSITDHAYLMPAVLVVEIFMSDAMAVYQDGQFTSDPSKSVSAFQTLLNIQALRTPLTIATRLNTYQNMFIDDIRAPDNYQTRYALKCTVRFGEIIVGNVTTSTPSDRPQQSTTTNEGPKSPQSISPSTQTMLDSLIDGPGN